MEIEVKATKKIPAPEYITMVYERGQDLSMLHTSNTVYNSGEEYLIQSIQKEQGTFRRTRVIVTLVKVKTEETIL